MEKNKSNSHMPLVSVIVPVYNTENYLNKCIDNLLNQDYPNLEIIVIEDASTDNSKQKLEKYKDAPNIKILYNKKNKGLAYSRNKGISNSNGEYISFIDSDDYVEPTFYTKIMNKMIKNNANVAICPIKIIYENRNNLTIINSCFSPNNAKIGYINNGLSASACNKIFQKSLFEHVRFNDEKINEDVSVIIPIIINTDKITYVSDTSYNYIQRENSIQNAEFSMKRFDIFDEVDNLLSKISNQENYNDYKDAIINSQLINLLIYKIETIKNNNLRIKALKEYQSRAKKYKLGNNKYFQEFIKNKQGISKIYYKILVNSIQKSYKLTNIIIEFKNIWRD